MGKLLTNAHKKLNNENKLTIGYFGGSITEGAGASDPSKTSWRAIITSWFKNTYPKASINEIQGAIGGTGSDLGAFRCQHDLLYGNPDLVFVEFAVNDYEKKPEDILRYMEGIVRQIWLHDINTDIVFIYTIKKEMAEACKNGEIPYSVKLHQKIADYYEFPSVNVGEKLAEYVRAGKDTWESLLTDKVHPSDTGHKIYSEVIKEFLTDNLREGEAEGKLKAPLTERPCESGRLVDAWKLWQEPWEKDSNSLSGRYPHMLVCNTSGAELEYHFKGETIGLYYLIAPDSGDFEWSIDEGAVKRQSSWDAYAKRFTRANYCILADNLDNSEHVLKIRIFQDKQPESKGNWIRIGAVLLA